MSFSIESRVPLLDYRIVELLSRMPPIMKFKGGQSKVIIKEISANWLPKSIINRKDKMGFPVPLGDWMQSGVVKEFVHDILLSSESLQRGIFSKEYLYKLVSGKTGPGARDLWGALSLELWFKKILK